MKQMRRYEPMIEWAICVLCFIGLILVIVKSGT